jgi:ABC-type amino acid transport substrate-binding protein
MVVAAVALGPIVAFACGDKLILLIGNARYRQVYNAHPASILAFTHQNSVVPGIISELEHQSPLKRGGHKFYSVDDLAGLDEALKAGQYDLVLADVADADGLEQHLQSAPSKPVVLPVVYNSTKAEAKAVEKKFHCVLKAPGSPSNYLTAIDDAMEVRLKGGSIKAAR